MSFISDCTCTSCRENGSDELRSTLESRVANGAEWLDMTWPGWEQVIDTQTLDLSSGYQCVLGQIGVAIGQALGCRVSTGNILHAKTTADDWGYVEILQAGGYDILSQYLEGQDKSVIEHGFASDGNSTYGDLDNVWFDLLFERQKMAESERVTERKADEAVMA